MQALSVRTPVCFDARADSTSKAAVIGLTKVIGKEYAEIGDITCNAVSPAVVRTAMVAAMPEAQVKCARARALRPRCRVACCRHVSRLPADKCLRVCACALSALVFSLLL